MNTDPLTGQPLPANAIQRILYLANKVHVYQIPPATSTKGYQASTWTADNNKRQIFTARLRILETSIPGPADTEKVSTTLLLEQPATCSPPRPTQRRIPSSKLSTAAASSR